MARLSMRDTELKLGSSNVQRRRFNGASEDLIYGLALWHSWATKAWYDILLRYRRTVIGPFWIVLSTGVMIACLSLIAPALFGGGNPDFIPYLTVGLISWNFVAMSIGELSATFIEQGNEIRNVRLPFSIYVYRIILRNIISYAHLLTLYLIVAIYFKIFALPYIPLFIAGLLLVVLNFVWVGFVLGTLCARYRDIQQVVGSVLTIGFLLTPVFWDKTLLLGTGARSLVVHLNPLAHMLEILRAPLLAQVPSWEHYAFLIGSVVLGFLLMAFLYAKKMRRVVLWI